MQKGDTQTLRLKTVAVGYAGAGKTCMFLRYVKDQFPERYVPTLFERYVADAEFDERNVELELWDTGGGEGHERFRPLNYPETDVFLLLFDITNHGQFEDIYSYWWKELNHHCPNVPIILVASKIDLRAEENLTFTPVQGEAMAEKIGAAKYMEISSLENWGIAELFREAIVVGHLYLSTLRNTKKKKCSIL